MQTTSGFAILAGALLTIAHTTASADDRNSTALVKKLGGALSVEIEGDAKLLKADFTSLKFSDTELEQLTGLRDLCILDI